MKKSIELIKNIVTSKDDYIVVGCSGGPDSMCLLNILLKNDYKVICVHVNHNIRKESDSELKFLKDYCKKQKIIFESMVLPKNETHNESYYREKRYKFYKNIADKYDTKYIMTAHHGDDLVETILMRISRGSYLKGYVGFPKHYVENGYIFIKPLVYYTKDDILNYNNEFAIPSVHDNTNDLDAHTRNRYRHIVLPFLKEENRDVHLKYLKYSEELESTYNYIQKIVAQEMDKNYRNRILDLKQFFKLDPYIQHRELEIIFKDIYKDEIYKINTSHLSDILELLKSNKNFKLSLPNNLKIKREYDFLYFNIQEDTDLSYHIELTDKTILPNGDYIEKIKESEDTSNFTIRLNVKDLNLPLYIRNRKPGDKIEIKNLNGSKKIKSIFIDDKIEPSKRDSYPLLVDAKDTVLWIPGLRKSKFDNEKDEKYDIILKYTKERKC